MSGMICGIFIGVLLVILFLVWLVKRMFPPINY